MMSNLRRVLGREVVDGIGFGEKAPTLLLVPVMVNTTAATRVAADFMVVCIQQSLLCPFLQNCGRDRSFQKEEANQSHHLLPTHLLGKK